MTEESAYPEDSSFDYIFNANMVHISEWRCTEGLFKLAGKVLRRGHGTGLLFLYGPFAVDGVLEPESNVRFDSILRNSIQQVSLGPVAFNLRARIVSSHKPQTQYTLNWLRSKLLNAVLQGAQPGIWSSGCCRFEGSCGEERSRTKGQIRNACQQ